MKKTKFLKKIRSRLKYKLSTEQTNEAVNYYAEMIDDYIEDGISEEAAVKNCGDLDDIIQEITGNYIKKKKEGTVKETRKSSKIPLALLIVGFPLWFPLLLAFFIIILSILLVALFVIIAIFVSSIACLLAGLWVFIGLIFNHGGSLGILLLNIGGGLIGLGLFLPLFYISKKMIGGYGKFSSSILKGSMRIFKGGN